VGGCALGSLSSELSDRDPDSRPALAGSFAQWSAAIGHGRQSMVERIEQQALQHPGVPIPAGAAGSG
jgi:hypothetical protein